MDTYVLAHDFGGPEASKSHAARLSEQFVPCEAAGQPQNCSSRPVTRDRFNIGYRRKILRIVYSIGFSVHVRSRSLKDVKQNRNGNASPGACFPRARTHMAFHANVLRSSQYCKNTRFCGTPHATVQISLRQLLSPRRAPFHRVHLTCVSFVKTLPRK